MPTPTNTSQNLPCAMTKMDVVSIFIPAYMLTISDITIRAPQYVNPLDNALLSSTITQNYKPKQSWCKPW